MKGIVSTQKEVRVIPPHENMSGEEWLRGTYIEIVNHIKDNQNIAYSQGWRTDQLIAKLSILLGIKENTISKYMDTLEFAGRIKRIKTDKGIMYKVID